MLGSVYPGQIYPAGEPQYSSGAILVHAVLAPVDAAFAQVTLGVTSFATITPADHAAALVTTSTS